MPVKSLSILPLTLLIIVLLYGPTKADEAVDTGREKAAMCVTCHGPNGEGVGDNPPLAGIDRQTLVNGMLAYKTGEKEEPMMAMLMQAFSDEDIANLAAFYASLPKNE